MGRRDCRIVGFAVTGALVDSLGARTVFLAGGLVPAAAVALLLAGARRSIGDARRTGSRERARAERRGGRCVAGRADRGGYEAWSTSPGRTAQVAISSPEAAPSLLARPRRAC